MNQTKIIFEKYWGYFALIAWIGLAISLDFVRVSPFALDEEASRGLLFTWTIADNVVNPIVIFGVPDFRALLYAPIGTYWSGNLLAAKIMSLFIAFLAITMLYKWARRTCEGETALVASALLIISPVLILQVDSLSAGPYILLGFALGAWLDSAYRKNPNYFGGWYFMQMIWVAILTTIHPLALAYPIIIAWSWYKNPHDTKKSRHIYVGLGIATILALLIHGIWRDIVFFTNPVEVLSIALQGSVIWSVTDIYWLPGIIAIATLAIVVSIDIKNLRVDLLGQMLLASILVGLIVADKNWALLSITFLLYRGTHHLLRFNGSRKSNNIIGQRGLVFGVALVLSTFFMLQDKNHILTIKHAALDPVDQLIQSLMIESEDNSKPFIVATQWPGRTMMATKRDAFPLPPGFDDNETMLKALKSVTHLIFDPYAEQNIALAKSIGNLGGATETLALMKGGVIVAVRDHNVKLSTQQRLAIEEEDRQSEKQDKENESKDPKSSNQ